MANVNQKVTITIGATARAAMATMEKFKGIVSKVRGSIFNLKNAFLGLATGVAIRQVLKLTDAYGLQQEAELQLTAALDRHGQATDENIKLIKTQASELQKLTGIGDEVTISTAAIIEQMSGLDAKIISDMLPGIQDMSRALNLDMNSAALLVAKSVSSSTNALTRYGVQIDASASRTEKAHQIVTQLSELFGGFAQKSAAGYAGKMKILSAEIGDLKEKLGKALLPTVLKIAEKMQSVAENINKMNFSDIKISAQEFFTATKESAGSLYESLKNIYNILEKVPYLTEAIGFGIIAMFAPTTAWAVAITTAYAGLQDYLKIIKQNLNEGKINALTKERNELETKRIGILSKIKEGIKSQYPELMKNGRLVSDWQEKYNKLKTKEIEIYEKEFKSNNERLKKNIINERQHTEKAIKIAKKINEIRNNGINKTIGTYIKLNGQIEITSGKIDKLTGKQNKLKGEMIIPDFAKTQKKFISLIDKSKKKYEELKQKLSAPPPQYTQPIGPQLSTSNQPSGSAKTLTDEEKKALAERAAAQQAFLEKINVLNMSDYEREKTLILKKYNDRIKGLKEIFGEENTWNKLSIKDKEVAENYKLEIEKKKNDELLDLREKNIKKFEEMGMTESQKEIANIQARYNKDLELLEELQNKKIISEENYQNYLENLKAQKREQEKNAKKEHYDFLRESETQLIYYLVTQWEDAEKRKAMAFALSGKIIGKMAAKTFFNIGKIMTMPATQWKNAWQEATKSILSNFADLIEGALKAASMQLAIEGAVQLAKAAAYALAGIFNPELMVKVPGLLRTGGYLMGAAALSGIGAGVISGLRGGSATSQAAEETTSRYDTYTGGRMVGTTDRNTYTETGVTGTTGVRSVNIINPDYSYNGDITVNIPEGTEIPTDDTGWAELLRNMRGGIRVLQNTNELNDILSGASE